MRKGFKSVTLGGVRIYVLLTIIPILVLLSCKSPPKTEEVPSEERPALIPEEQVAVVPEEPGTRSEEAVIVPVDEEEVEFHPSYITEEAFETALHDIQDLVLALNKIISAKNYTSWLMYLSDGYRNRINSKEFLDNLIIRYPAFRGRIRNSRDYFLLVIVPSRASSEVTDIEFISWHQVRAYTRDSKGNTTILYNLEDYDGKWKIAEL